MADVETPEGGWTLKRKNVFIGNHPSGVDGESLRQLPSDTYSSISTTVIGSGTFAPNDPIQVGLEGKQPRKSLPVSLLTMGSLQHEY